MMSLSVLQLADVIAITEIYYEGTGESPIPGVTGQHLAKSIEAYEAGPLCICPTGTPSRAS